MKAHPTYPFGDSPGLIGSTGPVDLGIYREIGLRWSNNLLILTVGRCDYTLTPEQLAQFREALWETKLSRK